MKPVDVLMVEDNRGDVVLLTEAVRKIGLDYHLRVVTDGVEALTFLRRQAPYQQEALPDLIILDLKLPRKSGREVIDEIQLDPSLYRIPLVIFSSSRSELEMARMHQLPRQTQVVKPSRFEGYVEFVRHIESFRRTSERGDLPRCR